MIFILLTFLSALSLAAVSGWFSIIGMISIYAAAPIHALIMGFVLESGKLVTVSWLYRNWSYSNWKLKSPLVIFTLILILANGIGGFGFLSKAHLEQGAGTIDNSSKIERLDQQILREKSTIDDDQKVITQLDNTINSYLGKDRADRSVVIRKSQIPQRKQLRDDIDASQKRIDEYSDQKLKFQSEIKKMQLDVGPIRYIAELIYGTTGDVDKNIESAVRIFTLIIVSTLDPLAVILLIAANHTLLRRENEKETQYSESTQPSSTIQLQNSIVREKRSSNKEELVKMDTNDEITCEEVRGHGAGVANSNFEEKISTVNHKNSQNYLEEPDKSKIFSDNYLPSTTNIWVEKIPDIKDISPLETKTETQIVVPGINYEEEKTTMESIFMEYKNTSTPVISSPVTSRVSNTRITKTEFPKEMELPKKEIKSVVIPWAQQESTLRELIGSHFVPQKVIEEKIIDNLPQSPILNNKSYNHNNDKYPKVLNWLDEFKRI